jgi:hypothetical protein
MLLWLTAEETVLLHAAFICCCRRMLRPAVEVQAFAMGEGEEKASLLHAAVGVLAKDAALLSAAVGADGGGCAAACFGGRGRRRLRCDTCCGGGVLAKEASLLHAAVGVLAKDSALLSAAVGAYVGGIAAPCLARRGRRGGFAATHAAVGVCWRRRLR